MMQKHRWEEGRSEIARTTGADLVFLPLPPPLPSFISPLAAQIACHCSDCGLTNGAAFVRLLLLFRHR
jgi:hypothetical protein